jgi:hypothetical protein
MSGTEKGSQLLNRPVMSLLFPTGDRRSAILVLGARCGKTNDCCGKNVMRLLVVNLVTVR